MIIVAPAGLFIDEIFQYQKKWYGRLYSEDNNLFVRFVEITKFYPGGCDWSMLSGEKGKKIANYFAEIQKKSNTQI